MVVASLFGAAGPDSVTNDWYNKTRFIVTHLIAGGSCGCSQRGWE